MPVFFDMGSVAQLVFGLLVCFISFGAYMMLSPYQSQSDDRLAQLCQMQIFFSLVSSLIIRFDDLYASAGGPSVHNLDVMLVTFTFLPIATAVLVHILEEGLYDYLMEVWIRPGKAFFMPCYKRFVGPLRAKIAAPFSVEKRVERLAAKVVAHNSTTTNAAQGGAQRSTFGPPFVPARVIPNQAQQGA